MGLARGGARGSGSRYRARCAVVLRWLRLRLSGLRLWLWERVQLSVLRLWLWDRLQLSGLHRLQLPAYGYGYGTGYSYPAYGYGRGIVRRALYGAAWRRGW